MYENENLSPMPRQVDFMPDCLPLTPEKEAAQRVAVIEEALKWNKTPYHQLADILGVGIDCAMLLVRAWVDSGVLQPFDPRPYPPNWHLHHAEERYLEWMLPCGKEVERGRAGDVVVYFFGRCFSHGGILINDKGDLMNASQLHSQACISNMEEPWLKYIGKRTMKLRPFKFFDPWGHVRGVPS